MVYTTAPCAYKCVDEQEDITGYDVKKMLLLWRVYALKTESPFNFPGVSYEELKPNFKKLP